MRTLPEIVFGLVKRLARSVIEKNMNKTCANQRMKLFAAKTGQVLDLTKISIWKISNLFDMNPHPHLQECSQVTRIPFGSCS